MEVVQTLYKRVCTLEEWLYKDKSVFEENDSPRFKGNLVTTLVAFNTDNREKIIETASPPSLTKDLIFRIIEKKIRYGENNVLTLGFGQMSDDPDAQVSCFTNIEYRHPNSSVNILLQGVWKKLHQRIGDAWMQLLLEETSIFVLCDETCYIQITGVPAFDVIKNVADTHEQQFQIRSSKAKPQNISFKQLPQNTSWKKQPQRATSKQHPQNTSSKMNVYSRKRKFNEMDIGGSDAKTGNSLEGLTTPLQVFSRKRKQRVEEIQDPLSKRQKLRPLHPKFRPYKFHLYMRQSYKYSTDLREKFPRSHILSQKSPYLYREIFLQDVTESSNTVFYLEGDTDNNIQHTDKEICVPYIKDVDNMLTRFYDNHRKCRYHAYFSTICKPKDRKNTLMKMGKNRSKLSTQELLKDFISRKQVYIFLRKIIVTVVPENLFGSKYNRNHFLKGVWELIRLGRFEKICLGQLMRSFKTKEVLWLKHVSSHDMKLHLVAKFLYWMMNNFVIPLIKGFFYVTETATFRNELFFYRKSVWFKLHIRGVRDLEKKGLLAKISQTEAHSIFKNGNSLGEASIRFLPKQKSLRPIANLGKQPPSVCRSNVSINKQLVNILSSLSYLTSRNPSWVGAAKFGRDDIFTAWKSFALQWRKKGKGVEKLYFVKTDVRNCFDGVVQEKLISIMEDLLSKIEDGEIIIRKYVSLVKADGKVRPKYRKKACGFGEYLPDFNKFVQHLIKESSLKNMVFVDQMVYPHFRTKELLEKIKSHVFQNIIKIGTQYFRQTSGISQGSVLSTHLCNIYYGQMEEIFMPTENGELMMRVVDDTIFVTQSKMRAEIFLLKSIQGNTEYNFSVNPDKILINFDCTHENHGVIKKNIGEWFPWCGLLFNTSTLEVGNDFTRYDGVCMRHTLTIDVSSSPGVSMKRKLFLSLKSKCHALLLDTELNSFEVSISNCFRLFLLLAFKFHCYASKLPVKEQLTGNAAFFLSMISSFHTYFYSQATIHAQKKFCTQYNFTLPRRVIKWLCWYAFLKKLKIHHSSYRSLISQIKSSLKFTERTLTKEDGSIIKNLRKICGNSLPVEFTHL